MSELLSAVMAPCYNQMRSLHYRTQSLPESVYNPSFLHHPQPHPAANSMDIVSNNSQLLAAAAMQQQQQQHYQQSAMELHHHQQIQQHRHQVLMSRLCNGASGGPANQCSSSLFDSAARSGHSSENLRKSRSSVGLRRSHTNAADLSSHRPAPLVAGMYDSFLPPPNFNSVGLPCVGGGGGHHHHRSHSQQQQLTAGGAASACSSMVCNSMRNAHNSNPANRGFYAVNGSQLHQNGSTATGNNFMGISETSLDGRSMPNSVGGGQQHPHLQHSRSLSQQQQYARQLEACAAAARHHHQQVQQRHLLTSSANNATTHGHHSIVNSGSMRSNQAPLLSFGNQSSLFSRNCGAGKQSAAAQQALPWYSNSGSRHPNSSQSLHHPQQQQMQPQQQTVNHHRSVPNLTAAASSSSLTTPLFVDCSVEYDLGDQPPVPANSEPLLAIHPEYVVKARSVSSSPYSQYPVSALHIRGAKLKSVNNSSPTNSTSINGGGGLVMTAGGLENARLHQQQRFARRSLIPGGVVNNNNNKLSSSVTTTTASSLSVNCDNKISSSTALNTPPLTTSSAGASNSTKMATSLLAVDPSASRKLSVESRDSGIGLINSASSSSESNSNKLAAGSSWLVPNGGSSSTLLSNTSPADCDNKVDTTTANIMSVEKCSKGFREGGHAPAADSAGNNAGKRFGFTDLVSGLLCCSGPVQGVPSLPPQGGGSRTSERQPKAAAVGPTEGRPGHGWTQPHQLVPSTPTAAPAIATAATGDQKVPPTKTGASQPREQQQAANNSDANNNTSSNCWWRETGASGNNTNRTVEWVMESQKMLMMSRGAGSTASGPITAGSQTVPPTPAHPPHQSANGHAGGSSFAAAAMAYCGQDCGDGFCYNVWNSMVHV